MFIACARHTAVALAVLFIALATTARGTDAEHAQFGSQLPMVRFLATQYLEAPKAIGTISQKHFMEACVSQAGIWTILMTTTNGYSCIIASGDNWEDVPFKPGARS